MFEKNVDLFYYIARNPAAIHLIEENTDDIDWDNEFAINPAAMHLIEENKNILSWENLEEYENNSYYLCFDIN